MLRLLILLTFVFAPLLAAQPPNGPPKKSDAVVHASAKAEKPSADGRQTVRITLKIDRGWHVYANPVGNEDLQSSQTKVDVKGKSPAIVRIAYPKCVVVKDKIVGDYSVYEGDTTISAVVAWHEGNTPGPFTLAIRVQACNDRTCLLPATIEVPVP